MSTIDKISIAITREQHERIKAAVASGAYATTSEVIRDALRDWEHREELRRLECERIGRLWDEGIASGPSLEGPETIEAIRQELGLSADAALEAGDR